MKMKTRVEHRNSGYPAVIVQSGPRAQAFVVHLDMKGGKPNVYELDPKAVNARADSRMPGARVKPSDFRYAPVMRAALGAFFHVDISI